MGGNYGAKDINNEVNIHCLIQNCVEELEYTYRKPVLMEQAIRLHQQVGHRASIQLKLISKK